MSKSIAILGAVTVFLILAFSVVNIRQGNRNFDRLLNVVSASAEADAQKEITLGKFDFLAEAYGFGEAGRRVPGIGIEKYDKCLKEVAPLRIYLRSGDVTWEKTELEALKELTETPKSTQIYAASFNPTKFKWLNESGVVPCT